MIPIAIMCACWFVAGIFLGDWIGMRRARWLVNRGIRDGRLNLTTTRAHRRRQERLRRRRS